MQGRTTIGCVVGARPNFVKIAPILRCLERVDGVDTQLIHTGQHYDAALSDVFFEELGIRRPDVSLGVGSGSHGKQTADVLVGMENFLLDAARNGFAIDRLVVVGDVNSTMAATLAAAKLSIPVAHVEAGLRSRDRSMPEEINRIVTDSLSDLLFCSEPSGVENLLKEDHDPENVHLVGNVMIDTLLAQLDAANDRNVLNELGLTPHQYAVVTLHRPVNVDNRDSLSALVEVLSHTSRRLSIVFPVHPRTKQRLVEFDLLSRLDREPKITTIGPLAYRDFLCLTSQAKVVVTDSGGLQEETTVLGIPCLTMRENTERPITVELGTSTLVGSDSRLLAEQLGAVMDGNYKTGSRPDLWDGQAAERIVELLRR